MQLPPKKIIQSIVRAALAEDIGRGDVTTLATVPKRLRARAKMVARENLLVCGGAVAEIVFHAVSPGLRIKTVAKDGEKIAKGGTLLEISGEARAILTAERVALNFVQRLSGIATLTGQFVAAIKGTRAKILDTRKTTPGLRLLEKYAVACGGGQNHRIGLFDMILIKDNHLVALRNESPNAIEAAVNRARKKFPKLKVEVEADTREQAEQAVRAGADIVLLDNMDLKTMGALVKWVDGRAGLEASGGVNLKTVRAIAKTGVDFISVGALTHSARAVDVALDFEC